jgi:MFS family permease
MYLGVTALIALCQFLFAIDFHSVNIALGSIGADLSLAPALLSWVMSAYFLGYAGFLILGGKIGDLFGTRVPCVSGVVAFGLASIGASVAPSLPILLVCRGVEGLACAFMIPTSFSLINLVLPPGRLRHRAFAIYGASQGLAMLLGQNLGGWMTTNIGWRSVFMLNLPPVIGALILASKFAPRQPLHVRQLGRGRARLDATGAVLITTATALLLYGISESARGGLLWPGCVVGLVGAIALFSAFGVLESRLKQPLVPLSLFSHPNLAGADLACVALAASVGSLLVLLNLHMQEAMHFTASMSGVRMLPFAIAMIATGQLVEYAMSRFPVRRTILASALVTIVGSAMFSYAALSPNPNYIGQMVPAMVVFCVGSTAANIMLMALGTAAAPPDRQGLATGVLITCLQIGMALGVSISLTVLNAGINAHLPLTQAFAISYLISGASATVGIACVLLLTRPERAPLATVVPTRGLSTDR